MYAIRSYYDAESRSAVRPRRSRPLEHRLDFKQCLGLYAGVVTDALRAVGTVLRAGSGLDGQERAHLHFVRVEIATVHTLSMENQIRKR